MSITSKARRDAKKKKLKKAINRARANAPRIEPHAELRNPQGELLAGIVRQAGVWVLGMDGKIAGSSDSAAEVFAMIKRAAALFEAQGQPVRLVYSNELRDTAVIEAAAQGMTLEEFDARLAEEMRGQVTAAAGEDAQGSASADATASEQADDADGTVNP